MASMLAQGVQAVTRTAIRAVVLRHAWADLLFERPRLVEEIRAEVVPMEQRWGTAIGSLEIIDITRG